MFILKRKHRAIVDNLKNQIEGLNRYYRNEIANVRKHNAELSGENIELHSRLKNAVEGLTEEEKEVLKSKQEGFYVYSVYRKNTFVDNVRVPISCKNCDYIAKKAAGIKSSEMKGAKAIRWTI